MAKDVKAAMPDLTKTAVLYVQSEIPPYPPPLPDQRYVRTGTLGRVVTSFGGGEPGALSRVETLDSGAVGYVGGRLEYIADVIGEGQQAAIHAGRWWTLQSVLRGAREGIVRIFVEGVRSILRRG
jgi:hypothetical protein